MSGSIHTLTRGIIIVKNRILLAYDPRWNAEFYYLPGGHIENMESAEKALLRELQEEIGLSSFSIERFLGCLEYSFKPKLTGVNICHTHEYNFLFLVSSPELDPNCIPEQKEPHVGLKWIPVEDLKTTNILPEPLAYLIPKWLGPNKEPTFYSVMI